MIDEFNKIVELGEDKGLGRTIFCSQLDERLFYASPRLPIIRHTMGGE